MDKKRGRTGKPKRVDTGEAVKQEAMVPLPDTPRDDKTSEAYKEPPVGYDEWKYHGDDCPEGHPDWVSDYGDQVLPARKGFLTDFVFFSRGVMTPTVASLWTALFVLSSAIKREAWLEWVPQELHTNQYVIIIGPAGLTKKTTAVTGFGLPLLRMFRSYISDRNVYEMKKIDIVKDKTSPESLLTAMSPESKAPIDYYLKDAAGELITDEAGRAIPVRRTSEVALIVSELSTLLSSASYSQSTTQILLDMYDCHDDWEWRTEKRGVVKLRWLHTTMLAGTTINGFRDSIPKAAKGDGFLSRSVLVYVPQSKRRYPKPFMPYGAPDLEEMAKRLAWIVEHATGEYKLSPEAEALFTTWYDTYYRRMEDFPEFAGAISRMDINVLKTALLVHVQRYDGLSKEIDEEDLIDAIKLVEATYQSLPFLMGQLEEDVILRNVEKVSQYLERKGSQKRSYLLSMMHLRSDILNSVLDELVGRGLVAVEYKGMRSLVVSGRTEEKYVWLGGNYDGESEAVRLWSAKSFIDARTLRVDPAFGKAVRSKPHSPAALADGKPRRARKSAGEAKREEPGRVNKKTRKKGKAYPVGKRTPGSKVPEELGGNSPDDRMYAGPGTDVSVEEEKECAFDSEESA